MPTGIYPIEKRKGLFHKGYKHSKEIKQKISNSLMNRKLSSEQIQKIRLKNIGKKRTNETKRKISEKLKGNKNAFGCIRSEETKRKLSESKKGEKNPAKRLEIRKKISEKLKGRKLSEETKRKISEAMKGEKNYFFGKKHTEEVKRKMSNSLKGRIPWNKDKKFPQISGKEHWNWKEGITPINNQIRASLEYKLWQDSVFARDGYRCQKSGEVMKPYKLVAHHIQNFSQFPELRFAIDNGITLSKESHQEFHRKYGIKNNTKEQLEEFLSTV